MQPEEQIEDEPELEPVASNPLMLLPAVSHEKLSKNNNVLTNFSGVFYTLFSCLLFTISTFVIKQLGVDLLDALLLRFILQTLLTLGYVLYKKYAVFGGTCRQVFFQLICNGLGASGLFLFFEAVRFVELSDVITICYTRVVWTVVLSAIIYRERPSIGIFLALPMTLTGVIFVTQPNFLFSAKNDSMSHVSSELRFIGFTMAAITSLTATISVLLFKQLISTSKDIKPSVLSLQFCVACVMFLCGKQIYRRSLIISWPFFFSSLISLITIVGSVLAQKGIKRENPAVFSLLGSSEIIFALILQNLFTSTRSNLYALLGSALVIGSVMIIGVTRILSERQLGKPVKTTEEPC